MSDRVTRDGDTVTVRCLDYPESDWLKVHPVIDIDGQFMLAIQDSGEPSLIYAERPDLAALGAELLALAGEPGWKAIAGKLALLSDAQGDLLEAYERGIPWRDRSAAAKERLAQAAASVPVSELSAALEGVGNE